MLFQNNIKNGPLFVTMNRNKTKYGDDGAVDAFNEDQYNDEIDVDCEKGIDYEKKKKVDVRYDTMSDVDDVIVIVIFWLLFILLYCWC